MRLLWLSILWMLSSAAFAQGAAENAAEAYTTIVFVGRLVSIRELPNPCDSQPEEDGKICINLDLHFQARYEILNVVAGDYPAKEIEVRIADHYGAPRFTKHPYALLFVAVSSKNAYLHKYQGFPVYRTASGGWASCGDPFYRQRGDGLPEPTPQIFAEDFGAANERKKRIEERDFTARDLTIKSGRIRCLRGRALSAIYEAMRTGAMKTRGVELPRWQGP